MPSTNATLNEDSYTRIVNEVEDYAILRLDKSGNIENWNKGAEKIKGYTAEEIIGKNFQIFYTDKDQRSNLPERLIAEAAEKGKASNEGWRVRKNGSSFLGCITITALHDDHGLVTGFLKVTRDLSERSAKERFSLVIESAPTAIVLINHEGYITLANHQMENVFGYSKDELLNQHIDFLIPLRFKEELSMWQFSTSTSNQHTVLGEDKGIYLIHKNGYEFPVEIIYNTLSFIEGALVMASITDLTERKKQEAHRLKSEFLANMSHELRTPMNAILGFSEMLIDQKIGPLLPKQLEYLKDIHASGDHLMHLINDILDLSKIESGKSELHIEPFPVEQLIDEVIKVLQPSASKKTIQFERHLDSLIPLLHLDKK